MILVLPWLLACVEVPESIVLTGTVHDAPYGGGSVVAGLTVRSRDASLELYSETVTSDDGTFQMDVAAAQDLYLELAGDGYRTTLFAGQSGFGDLDAGDETLWVHTVDSADTITADFGSCAEDAGEGGIIEGEVRLYMNGIASEDLPIVETAQVGVVDLDGNKFYPCHLDDEGNPSDSAEFTGVTGRFAFFGLPDEPLILGVAYGELGEDPVGAWYYPVNMQEAGIAPFYPLLVELVD